MSVIGDNGEDAHERSRDHNPFKIYLKHRLITIRNPADCFLLRQESVFE